MTQLCSEGAAKQAPKRNTWVQNESPQVIKKFTQNPKEKK